MKTIKELSIGIVVAFLISQNLYGQVNEKTKFFLEGIAKSRNDYKRKVLKFHKDEYFTICIGNKQYGKEVVKKIVRNDSLFLYSVNDTINILESYDSPHSKIYGLIWKNKSEYFLYVIEFNTGLIHFEKLQYSTLDLTYRSLVNQFYDFKHPVFSEQICKNILGGIRYFVATKYSHSYKEKFETIAFCYKK